MNFLEICYWVSLAAIVYTYAVYPWLLTVVTWLKARPVRRGRFAGEVSIVVAAFNEEATMQSRLDDLEAQLDAAGVDGEIIVVSDGSTDSTASIARSSGGRVRVVELPANMGKAIALNEGVAAARHDVVVFADARQRWAPDALALLLENFADPSVGAVSGDLVVESAPGVMAAVGRYWRFEKELRTLEGRLHSTVGVTGAISAVRKSLFRPIPPGTLLDDVYWPLQVVRQGYRVVHDERARAFDRLPERSRDEFRRKVRTLTGNYQLIALQPGAMFPWSNPVCWQYWSHKLVRLMVPWAMLGFLISSALLPGQPYQSAFWFQIGCYAAALAGLIPFVGKRVSIAAAAGSFLVLNMAAWLAFWNWLFGRAGRTWTTVEYQPRAAGLSPAVRTAGVKPAAR